MTRAAEAVTVTVVEAWHVLVTGLMIHERDARLEPVGEPVLDLRVEIETVVIAALLARFEK
jgi:hypothetical protein